MELTLKTRRILPRSDFQVAMVSLSFFACKSRETAFRFPNLMIFPWISASVLPPRASSMNQAEPTTAGLTHAVNWLIAPHTELLRSFNNFPFNPRLRAVQTSAQASPSSTQSSSLVIDSCIYSISTRSTQTA
jgi:hypothetical protein